MTASFNVAVECELIRDTFRQSRATGILWLMLGVSLLCIVTCLSVEIVGSTSLRDASYQPGDFLPRTAQGTAEAKKAERHGVSIVSGEMRIGFGAIRLPISRDAGDAVHFLQLILAGVVADTIGILLTLTWTAAFLPAFLESSSVSVLLAKPISRGRLLFGKYLGVLAFVLFQSTIFVVGTWLAIGLRTGHWDAKYLLCIPLLLLQFAVFFAFSVAIAVGTRSTIICVLGSILFWLACWGLNFGRHTVMASSLLTPEIAYRGVFAFLINACYWLLPKPADIGFVLFNALHAGSSFTVSSTMQVVYDNGMFSGPASALTSLAFGAVILIASAYEFKSADY